MRRLRNQPKRPDCFVPVGDYKGELASLRAPEYLESEAHQRQVQAPDWASWPEVAREFASAVLRRMARLSIPMHAEMPAQMTVALVPSALGRFETEGQAEICAYIALEVAQARGLSVLWAGWEEPTFFHLGSRKSGSS